MIALLAILIGVFFFGAGRLACVEFWKDFVVAIGIIVAMVPEGLLPTLTLSLVLATQRLARRNVLIRYLPSVEALGSTTAICTDKTGTLTQNHMTATRVFLGGRMHWSAGIEPGGALANAYRDFFLTAQLCHDLQESREQGSKSFLGDPMEVALVEMARRILAERCDYARLDEIPFDADRMRLSAVHAMPAGPALYCKGALESVLPLCSAVLLCSGTRPLSRILREQILAAHKEMAKQGLRVLAFGYRALDGKWERERLEQDLVFAGLVGLEDPPRPEVPEALCRCREAGIRVIMITGDHPRTAKSIACEIGLAGNDPVVITGQQLRSLSESQLMLVACNS
jgi:magnesium-transporting ATPase (P-type)